MTDLELATALDSFADGLAGHPQQTDAHQALAQSLAATFRQAADRLRAIQGFRVDDQWVTRGLLAKVFDDAIHAATGKRGTHGFEQQRWDALERILPLRPDSPSTVP